MRPIDADSMKAEVESLDAESNNRIYQCAMEHMLEFFVELIDKQPTIEAEPVRHGHWIDKGEYAVCSECAGRSGTQYDGVEPIPLMTQFCPHCGAKMSVGDNNG